MASFEKGDDLFTFQKEHIRNCIALKILDRANDVDLERSSKARSDAKIEINQVVMRDVKLLRLTFSELLQTMEERWRQTAIEFSRLLPVISESELRSDCIYRGGLLRNLELADEAIDPREGVKIENLAFRLNPRTYLNMVDFANPERPEAALIYALRGDPHDTRTRGDAMVIEAPRKLVCGLTRIPEGNGDKISLLPDLFKGDRLRIFKVLQTTE